ncbi:MAG: transketolase [Candidatus Atribacteria bacterium]|nr:transketolase [Candidatus Atribacteria bacterium]
MPIVDSKTGEIKKDYSLEELVEKAKEMRAYSMVAITVAGSGHTGGSLSITDIAAALYLKHINHDPANPEWNERDRVFWSIGHKAPVIYAALGLAGYFPIAEMVKLRKLWSGFEGHPNRFTVPGIELSSGSLGQGLGVAVGCALNGRLEKKNYKVFCILGDGELNEGSVWEAIMSAAHYRLDNLIAIVDRNRLQIDGPTEEVMKLENLSDKWQSFGWQVLEVDGHSMAEILSTLKKASEIKGKPIVIIAHTIKGKGVSFAENVVGYHGICPKDGLTGAESLKGALQDIDAPGFDQKKVDQLLKIACDYQEKVNRQVEESLPKFSKNYWWNSEDIMRVEMIPTRNGFGDAIAELGESSEVVTFGADITSSIKMDQFYANNPERKERFFQMGIAEQNMTVAAAGFAKEGKTAFIGSYGVFVTGRNWDQIRTTLCYNNFNVKIVNAHGGLSVGPDGATHQALEEISNMYYLPNMRIIVPADSIETKKGTFYIANIPGPVTIRYAREATPVVTTKHTPFQFGIANIIRFRAEKEDFVEAFETQLSTEYQNEEEDIALIACGPMVAEAMRAAYILKKELNLECRVINIHTVKPIDKEAIIRATQEIGVLLSVEEHQKGGFGNIVAGVIATEKKAYSVPFLFDMMGVNDEFGLSGAPWELLKVFGLTAEHIAKRAIELYHSKK